MASYETTPPAPQEELVGIIGCACRVPGATTLPELWSAINEQKDLRKKMPANRFNADAYYHPFGNQKGTTNAMYGYFLDQNVGLFDAEFFKIPRKEAVAMDPQQRIILEVVYEALEQARIPLGDIAGSSTSVYCGSFSDDYTTISGSDNGDYPKYTVTGTGASILSNRVSYFFDLHGESMTVNTACSSSLICLHLGNQSIMSGQSDMAIVIGSALHLDPRPFISMAEFGMLSKDGRSRSFDEFGQGYARGEGICAIVLKNIRRAREDGDVIQAVIRATAANHDGIKHGITLPSSEAQEALIRRAYRNARINTRDTMFVEAHGTGTPAGDPREAKAIGAIFGSDGRTKPILLGSIKSVIGHLEGAAGIVGVIKAMMCVQKGKVPGNMHFLRPNPSIDFKSLKLQVPTKTLEFPQARGPRRVSVNSFGYGGSNSHVIIEQYSSPEVTRLEEPSGVHKSRYEILLPLTAHSKRAGRLFAEKVEEYLKQNPHCNIARLATTLGVRRTMNEYRTFLVGSSAQDLLSQMKGIKLSAAWKPISSSCKRLGFVFTGQGAQYAKMGQQLIEQVPIVRDTLERCSDILNKLPDRPEWKIIDELNKSHEFSNITKPEFSQPICTAIQIALVELLKSWNIVPYSVVGHSSGEIAAAFAAGILTLESAMIVSYYRGRYATSTPATIKPGIMIAVGMSLIDARVIIRKYGGRIDVAAINSPESITISGDEDAILELVEELKTRNIFARKLIVRQAYHSHHMLALGPAYLHAMEGCQYLDPPRKPHIRMVSSVSGRVLDKDLLCPKYWVQNLVSPVRFMDALIDSLIDDNERVCVDAVIEVGPSNALESPIKQVLVHLGYECPYIATLIRKSPSHKSLLSTAGQLFQLGYSVDLEHMCANAHRQSITTKVSQLGYLHDFPSYCWDHEEYWFQTRQSKAIHVKPYSHILLGTQSSDSTPGSKRWRNFLRLKEIPWLADHKIQDTVIFPAAGYISMAIEAMIRTRDSSKPFYGLILSDISIETALRINDSESGVEVIFELTALPNIPPLQNSNLRNVFKLYSFADDATTIEHCCGIIEFCSPQQLKSSQRLSPIGVDRDLDIAQFYRRLLSVGVFYGREFRRIDSNLKCGPGVSCASVRCKDDLALHYTEICLLHPALLDALFHPIFAALEGKKDRPLVEAAVPTIIESFHVSAELLSAVHGVKSKSGSLQVTATAYPSGLRGYKAEIDVGSEENQDAFIRIRGLVLTQIGKSLTWSYGRELFNRLRWQPVFQYLEWSSKPLDYSTEQLIDIYAHEFPKARVLVVAEDPRRLLSMLVQQMSNGFLEHRRFSKMKIASGVFGVKAGEYEELVPSAWSGFMGTETPKPSQYDLIVVGSNTSKELYSFLKPQGFVLTVSDIEILPLHLDLRFRSLTSKCFQLNKNLVKQKPQTLENTAIILAKGASLKVQEVTSVMQEQMVGKLDFWELSCAGKSPQSLRSTIVVLVSLDEDILWQDAQAEQDNFQSVKSILTIEGRRVIWVLNGACFESSKPQQAIMLGMIRTARNENSLSQFTVLDVASDYNSRSMGQLLSRLICMEETEDELVERNGILYIPRLVPDDELNAKLADGYGRLPSLEDWSGSHQLVLKAPDPGSIKSMAFASEPCEEIGPYDLEIEVLAAGVSRRDISTALGRTPSINLGGECTGKIRRKGVSVSDSEFVIGDHVLCWKIERGTHKNLVRTASSTCIRIEPSDTATAASCCFDLTLAIYALLRYARIKQGDKVLVGAAATTLGQMVIQICRNQNVDFTAIAKTDVEELFLSVKLQLSTSQIVRLSNQSGVESFTIDEPFKELFDVVLNDFNEGLTSTAISALKPCSKFVELGSNFADTKSTINLSTFPTGASYCNIDLASILAADSSLVGILLRETYDFILHQNIQPPEVRVFLFSEASKAYQFVESSPGLVKALLSCSDERMTVSALPMLYQPDTQLFNPRKTYLLVGGFSGLGCALANWMIRKGARQLAFFSRTGPSTVSARSTLMSLRARGIVVQAFKGDVTQLNSVQRCIQTIGDNLGGIFQLALVLRDNLLKSMSYMQWKECVDSKAKGTYNLDVATSKCNVEMFVCFSSASAMIGSKGQSNYSAGNCYMDALMKQRRYRGLPGTTLNIGMILGIGLIAENNELEVRMLALGFDPLAEHELFYQITQGTIESSSLETTDKSHRDMHQIITGVRCTTDNSYQYSQSNYRCLASIIDNELIDTGSSASKAQDIIARIKAAETEKDKIEVILGAFCQKICLLTGLSMESINPSKTISSYGIDSLVASDVRLWFMKAMGANVPTFEILGQGSIRYLAEKASESIPAKAIADSVDCAKFKFEGTTRLGRATPETLESLVSGSSKPSLASSLLSLEPQKAPLSSLQAFYWSYYDVLKARDRLFQSSVIYIHGSPDFEILHRAATELVGRHEILRTAIVIEESQVWQKPHALTGWLNSFAFYDFSQEHNPQEEVDKLVMGIKIQDSNIETGDLFRLTVASTAPNNYVFVCSTHALVVDQIAAKCLIDQILNIYDCFARRQDIDSIAKPEQQYIQSMQIYDNFTKSEAGLAQTQYWKETFTRYQKSGPLLSVSQPALPSDRPMLEVSHLKTTMTCSRVSRMRRISLGMDGTMFDFLICALRAFFSRYVDTKDLVINMLGDSSVLEKFNNNIGVFSSILPLGFPAMTQRTFEDLFIDLKSHISAAFENRTMSYGAIVNAVGLSPEGPFLPLGQLFVNYVVQASTSVYQTLHFTAEHTKPKYFPNACEIGVEATEMRSGELELHFEYSPELYRQEDMKAFFGKFKNFLESAIRDHRQPLDEMIVDIPNV